MNSSTLSHGPRLLGNGVEYRVWAPEKSQAKVVINDGRKTLAMTPAGDGFYSVADEGGRAGDRYQYSLGGETLFPDPASHYQPDGVHAASMVVDHRHFNWRNDAQSRARTLDQLVIYELHVGTFTDEGTFRAAIEHLDYLVELGVSAIEIMPIADFPGKRNWGYDGVMLYAPSRAYGAPDDLRALVDAAHGKGLSVILDVVYNHLGPDGNYFGAYTPHYFNPAHKTPWGDALNFDGEHNGPVRDFFRGNVIHWMENYHIDGFRLDAVHAIIDDSPRHILAEIAEAVHERGGFVTAEDERNEARLATPASAGGVGMDGLWADDFHHSVRVAITGEQESYLGNFNGSPEELCDTLEHGWHYRGQVSPTDGKPRGTSADALPPHAFVYCISNHDQVGNRALGERLTASCSPAAYRAASALLCLAPGVPLIFQGQEWGASTPFLYFTDHNAELGRLVTEGRRREFKGFAAFGDEESVKRIPDPQAKQTFNDSKLDWSEITDPEATPAKIFALYREALRLRRNEPAMQARDRNSLKISCVGGGIIRMDFGAECFALFRLSELERGSSCVLRWENGAAQVIFSSNDPSFGGNSETVYVAGKGTVEFGQPGFIVFKTRPR